MPPPLVTPFKFYQPAKNMSASSTEWTHMHEYKKQENELGWQLAKFVWLSEVHYSIQLQFCN